MGFSSREELYKAVWEAPFTEIAPRHDMMVAELAELCNQLAIPHPRTGYWSKARHGHTQTPPPLPPAPEGTEHLLTPPGRHPMIDRFLRNCLPAVESQFGYLLPTRFRLADILISPAQLQRATECADTFFRRLEKRGYPVTCWSGSRYELSRPYMNTFEPDEGGLARIDGVIQDHWAPNRPTVVAIAERLIGLTFFERSACVSYRRTRDGSVRPVASSEEGLAHRGFLPIGILGLRAYDPRYSAEWTRVWTEDAGEPLLSQLDRIIEELEKVVTAEREPVGRQTSSTSVPLRDADRASLRAAVERWKDDQAAIAFLDAAEAELASLDDPDEAAQLRDALESARQHVEAVNALDEFRRWAEGRQK